MGSGNTTSLFDVLIIGGGPAGLSAATGLARQLYTAVVFDSGVYRNERAAEMHNFVTWDHREPAEFRNKAQDDLMARYQTIQFEKKKIESVEKTPKGYFQATDASGQVWEGRRLVLATGVRDLIPDIEGYDDCWGRGMYVYHSLPKILIPEYSSICVEPRVLVTIAYSVMAMKIAVPPLPGFWRSVLLEMWEFHHTWRVWQGV